jgi:hypothetical protein
MTVWRREERSSVMPYGAPDRRTMFTPDRIAIEKLDGTLVAEGRAPRDSFAGHQMNTPWDPLQRAYFMMRRVFALDVLACPRLAVAWASSPPSRTRPSCARSWPTAAARTPSTRPARPHPRPPPSRNPRRTVVPRRCP